LCYHCSASLEASMKDMGVTSIRLPEALLRRLDNWREGCVDEEDRPMTRSAAIRILVKRGMMEDAVCAWGSLPYGDRK
jgi:predicted transcriptional regulator